MSQNYTSFLVCFHPTHTDVYREGLPLGVIREGVFQVHEHTMPNGEKYPVNIDRAELRKVVAAFRLVKPVKKTKPTKKASQ